MKKYFYACLVSLLFCFLFSFGVGAQSGQISLKLSRDFGYGGLNGDIQGLFSMKVVGPSDLSRVDYFIDNTQIGSVSHAPFNLQFTTDNYPLGPHQLSAVGYSTIGTQYQSNIISANFVPAQSSQKVILPVLGIILLAVLLSIGLSFFGGRGRYANVPLGAERNYGAGGGGICNNCHRPFPLPLLSAHLGFSKLARCPYCGKWGLVRIASISQLRQAEKDEILMGSIPTGPSGSKDDDKLQKDIDDSKYQGL